MSLLHENSRYRYYVDENGKLFRCSKNKTVDLGYIEDNWPLYKKLCESI